MASYTFGTKKLKPILSFGPYAGYLIESVESAYTEGQYTDLEFDRTETFKKFDFGLSLGIGCRYSITKRLLISLEARNNLGIINISKLPITNDKTLRTNSTNLLFGIAYQFGKSNVE